MDRLSVLPNTIIHHIFWKLPLRDVVGTSILSKRWKSLWTTTPYLNCENYTMSFYDSHGLRKFLNRIVRLRWNGGKIQKFKFESCYELRSSVYSAIDSCMDFAMRCEVEELYLHMLLESMTFGSYDPKDELYVVPQFLYSCSSVKVLSFKHCLFSIDENVQWDQLKSLTITQGFGLTEHVINQILSGSHQLEVLILSFIENEENLNIQSNSLKELSICKYLFDYDYLSVKSKLIIRTPNLEYLKLEGIPYSECLLINVSSLTHANLEFSGLHYYELDNCEFDWEDFETDLSSAQDFVGDKFSQILQTIQLVGSVTLFCCCIKVLRAMKMRSMRSSFPNVKSLKIGCCYDDFDHLAGLLEIFPQLKRLVLQHEIEDYYQDDLESLEFDAESSLNLPQSFLLELRTVDVTWARGDTIFPFIEILLKYACKLENMVFRVEKIEPPSPPSNSLLFASQKLQRMPRSSPNCTIDLRPHDSREVGD